MFQLNKFVKVVFPSAEEKENRKCIFHRNRAHNTNNFYGTLCMFIAFIFPSLSLCTHNMKENKFSPFSIFFLLFSFLNFFLRGDT